MARHRPGHPSWTEADGLPDVHLSALHENADGSLWVATLGHGLFHFDGRRAVRYTSAEGLFDETVFQIVADTRGWLWMTSNRGLFPLAACRRWTRWWRDSVRGALASVW